MDVNNTKIELSLGLVNNILGYLSARPYGEVFKIIQEIQLQGLPQIPPSDPAVDPAGAGLND